MRFNPPPNWPAAPAGWSPPPGWQPDPSWGPPPPGWTLWVSDSWFARNKVVTGVLGGLLALVLMCGMCSVAAVGGAAGDDQEASQETTATASATTARTDSDAAAKRKTSTAAVTFEITGSGRAMVTYLDQNFQVAQDTDALLPWSKDFSRAETGMNVNAQRASGAEDTITCRILRKGKVVSTNTSKGPYAMVSCTL
jgi:hypothetical protein